MPAVLAQHPPRGADHRRSGPIKAEVVTADERRATCAGSHFGHTFGHALEAETPMSAAPRRGVAWGMHAATILADAPPAERSRAGAIHRAIARYRPFPAPRH